MRASVASAAIHKKEMDCFVVASPLPRNDKSFYAFSNAKDTHPQTPSAREGAFKIAKFSNGDKNKKPRKLALSLIASVALTGVALDIVAAAVNCRTTLDEYTSGTTNAKGVKQIYTCTGTATNAELSTKGNHLYGYYQTNYYWDTIIQFGSASERLTIGGGTDQILVEFNRTNGKTWQGANMDYGSGYYKKVEFGQLSAADKTFVIDAQGRTWVTVSTIAKADMAGLTIKSNTTTPVGGGRNWDGDAKGIFQSVSIGNYSTIGTFTNEAQTVYTVNITDGASINTIDNKTSANMNDLNINSAKVNTITNSGFIGNLRVGYGSSINTITNTSGTLYYLELKGGVGINTINANGGTIRTINVTDGSSVGNVNVNGGTITTLGIAGVDGIKPSSVGSISGNGTIGTLYLGSADNTTPLLDYRIGATVNTLLIYGASVTINSGDSWNKLTENNANNDGQRISISGGCNEAKCMGASSNAITINLGDNISRDTIYELKNLVVSGTTGIGTSLRQRNVTAGRGAEIVWTNQASAFRLRANGSQAYITDVYRALALSYMRRNAMTQNILDTMTTKTFHSDNYYNQEVELRLLQYDMARLTNKSVRFSKTRRKTEGKIDKVREKMARLTLQQSKGQDLEKGYNNFELIDQLDAIFIPYTGRRDWRFFALPYGANSYVDMGVSNALEWAGGAIFGIQRNLRSAGIFGGYVGYEFVSTDTQSIGAPTRVQTNSLQAGLNYFKTFAVTSKVWEGFIKATIRGGVDLPQFRLEAGGRTNIIEVDSDRTKSKIPLMWSVGGEVKGGITFYQFKRNSYVAPEVGLSYDVLSSVATKLIKPTIQTDTTPLYPIGANEYYGAILWHLPQISAAVRYYKMWGNTFRTNLKVGVRYNVLNTPQLGSFKYGNTIDDEKRTITLPVVYGNLSFDLIWLIKKNHELSLGYDGLFYASTFDKSNDSALSQWFNGVTTTLNLKYAYWFGGSDYVKDKDGNAVSRSILEGKKSKKSSKKDKPKKKSKKSKKKTYYIDG
ncbi:hypothetical protein [Helicobacter sp. MIT 01-3238]|uniref:hypothetical protein n=1 Tax=Helicobacter sp. MIT 01-3238 TaxID=398627 RepID=UPI000E1E84C8|nr:hypothetical protein [Helicobacter sp. MIT 01-3238]RDU53590.1 hypothetical protein CQA40_04670 [Helicobacter sp. MIT 01-3238]